MGTISENILYFETPRDKDLLEKFIISSGCTVVDLMPSMINELVLNKFPSVSFDSFDFQSIRENLIEEKISRKEGVFVYYPWKNRIFRILDREDFIFLRTCRNFPKISREEQEYLGNRTIGIIGLSVGFSVLMSLAIERAAGYFKIADFDQIELTNLNRIFQPIENIGLNKAIAARRAILEIDPYLKVEIFDNGITKGNIEEFLVGERKLDLLIDECDSGSVKYLSRYYARANAIPVIMETSDRGVIDIERYDLDQNYPLLHGRFKAFDISNAESLSKEILMASIDFSEVSKRGKISMSMIGKEIRTWPQLGSDVLSGGGAVCIAAKKVLLKKEIKSQRKFIDIESKFD
jgi:molybdopterin/thiamine biosynthesis adenylyltransferase